MESLSERSEKQRVVQEEKRHKKVMRMMVIFTIICIMLIALVIFRIVTTNTFHSYKVLDAVEHTDSSTVVYKEYDNGLIKYSRDGVLGYNEQLNKIWSGSYNFSSPMIDTSGDYAVLADSGGKEIYVFNGKNLPVQIDVLYPISLIQVATQGVVAVVMENGLSDLVQMYDSQNNKKLLVEFATNTSEDGYPIDVSLSPDGSKLVTSYISITNGTISTKITFYNLGEVGKNYSNKIVGSEKYDKEMVTKVQFLDNNTVCAFRTSGYSLYSMKQLVDKIKTEKVSEQIKSVFYSQKYFGFVYKKNYGSTKNEVAVYNLKAKNVLTRELEFAYKKVYMSQEQLFFLSDREGWIMRLNGTYKFKGTFKREVSYLMSLDAFNRYILVDKNKLSTIKLKEG